DLVVYVSNGTSGRYISAISAIVVTPETGTTQTVGDKVDPSQNAGGLIFANHYFKTNGGPDPVANSVLSISKTVAGSLGDLTKYFSFSLTVNKAATITTTPVYKVFVLEGTNVVTSSSNVDAASLQTDATYGVYFEVTSGAPISVNLMHGQRLSFIDAAVGTTYSITEAATADYTPSVAVVVNGATAVETPGTEGASLSIENKLVGEGANSAAFTNTYKTVTPTGISINNLPFYIMIALAVGAFIAFVVVKSRKRAYSSKH
ncbi:MAG: hypothetical protein ACK5L3_09945, partial [Oscillospiraceae bacterium]